MIDDRDGVICYPEFEPYVLGFVERCGQAPVLCYDREAVLAHLAKDMGEEDALEYFDFNVLGLYAGEGTPFFLTRFHGDDQLAV